ncbi:MAG: hypothetical protein SGILL_008206 [Bacillariaceae sp.]
MGSNCSLKLNDFNLRGRGETLRFLLKHSRMEWEDCVVSIEGCWGEGRYNDDKGFIIPAGQQHTATGKKRQQQLPVLAVTSAGSSRTAEVMMISECHDIAKWIAERCDPSLLLAPSSSTDMQGKLERMWKFVCTVQDVVDPVLNLYPLAEAREPIQKYLREKFLGDLVHFTMEIGDGPFVCGEDLTYVDFAVFCVLDNLGTLLGEENVLERAAPGPTLRNFYDKMYRLPAISGRMMERPLAGHQEVGGKVSIIYSTKAPSRLDFVQEAWKQKFGGDQQAT